MISDKKAKNYDVALFFFSGHGVQTTDGTYILPVDAKLATPEMVKSECINLDKIKRVMNYSSCRIKIMILDASFQDFTGRRNSPTNIIPEINPESEGMLVALASTPGNAVIDVVGQRNSPYTEALLKFLDVPNLSVESFFKRVSKEVHVKTNGAQTPWWSCTLFDEFFFNRK